MNATKHQRGTILECPVCRKTQTVALPVASIECMGGLPKKHPLAAMRPKVE